MKKCTSAIIIIDRTHTRAQHDDDDDDDDDDDAAL